MSTHTVWGPIADAIGMCSPSEPVRGPYGTSTRRQYISAPSVAYRRSQARVPVCVDHRAPELGQVEHLELWPDGQLVAVATVNFDTGHDEHDPDEHDLGSVFWSPSIRSNPDGTIDLLELSLTRRPASIGLRACRSLPGDLHHRSARRAWTTPSNRVEAMLERAADTAQRDDPIVISTTPASAPPLTRTASTPPPTARRATVDARPGADGRNPWDGTPLPATSRANPRTGLWHSRGGPIIAVH